MSGARMPEPESKTQTEARLGQTEAMTASGVRTLQVSALLSEEGPGDGRTGCDPPRPTRERAQRPAATSLAAGALIVTGWSKAVRVIVKLRLPAVDEVPAIWTCASW